MEPISFGEANGQQQEASPESQESDISLLPGFLKNIPDQDRAIVGKYTKDWDSGVTKHLQGVHDKYKNELKPWQELGYDPQTVQRMIQFVDTINQDPAAAYRAMGEVLQNTNPELWQELQQMSDQGYEGYEGGEDQGQEMDFSGLDPAIQQYMESMRDEITNLRQMYEGDKQTAEQQRIEAQQFEAFDAMLDDVLEKNGIEGEDARDWITVQLAREVPLEQAVKNYQGFVNGLLNSQKRSPAPRIIGGQGGVPSDQVDASKLRGEQRRDYIANYLAQQAQQG